MSDVIVGLREALAFAPDNVPLRFHLARALLAAGRADEALAETRAGLARAGEDVDGHVLAHAAARDAGDEAARIHHGWRARAALSPEELASLAHLALRRGHRVEARELHDAAVAREPALRDLSLERALRLQVALPSDGAEGGPPPSATPPPARRRPEVRFADVGGMESLKERLRMELVLPMQHPDLFKAYARKVGGGLLLYGPPGCGKTHLARAAAGECGATFLPVEIQQVLDMWLGESEKHLHALFERARDEAPSILFFDELEAIGGARQQIRHGPGRRLVNQLLTELDGVGAANERVFVLGATNAPWDVDPALRRPGRFDRVVFVAPPDAPGRAAVLEVALRDRPVEGLDLAPIAARTRGHSGADLAHLVDVAAERALQDALRMGAVRPIRQADLEAACAASRPTTAEWLATARRYVEFANQGGLYDEVAAYLAAPG